MRVQTEEWRKFIPGIRMYKGQMTLFYNGEKLWNGDGTFGRPPLIYNEEERRTWEVIVVLPGVEIISNETFSWCVNVDVVIMSDTVRRIEEYAFLYCRSLKFVKLSTNLEYIGRQAFRYCESLTSIFIPPSCREIDDNAFCYCKKLIILSVPQDTQLGEYVITGTALIRASPFETDEDGYYDSDDDDDGTQVNEWIKNRHVDNQFSLHRACASYNPLEEVIFDIILRQGIGALKKPDSVGVTATQYLSQNPFTDIEEQKIMKRYILDMMGEIV